MKNQSVCALENINAYVDTEERWSIDDEGNLVDHIEDTDYMSDITSYYCNEHGESFETFEQVEAHLKEAK